MPRVNLAAERYAVEDFRREVRTKMGYYGIRSQNALALAAGFQNNTLSRRLRNPKTLSLEELARLHKVLKLDVAMILPLIGASKKEITEATKNDVQRETD